MFLATPFDNKNRKHNLSKTGMTMFLCLLVSWYQLNVVYLLFALRFVFSIAKRNIN